MSEYRTTATLTADGTFVVPSPEALPVGTEAEIVLRLPSPLEEGDKHPLESFLDELNLRPIHPEGAKRAEEAQAFLRGLREEWN